MSLLRPPLFCYLFLLSFVFLFCLNIRCFRAGSLLAYVFGVFCRTGTCPWYWGLLALLVVTCGHGRVGRLTQQVWSLQSQFSSGSHTGQPLGLHALRWEQQSKHLLYPSPCARVIPAGHSAIPSALGQHK